MKSKMFMILFLFSMAVYSQETVEFGPFGKMTLFQSTPNPKHMVLFVSGDGGVNRRVIEMAKVIASMDSLVVAVDIIHYLKQLDKSSEKCSYPAADFEELSKFIRKKKNFQNCIPPILMGYSSGATLVYALMVQAPPDTFAAGISLGFCPDLPLKKPFCKGNGLEWKPGPGGKGYIFLPSRDIKNPWIAFNGLEDKVCDLIDTEAFVKQVNNAEIVKLEKVGHGFKTQKNWVPRLKDTFLNICQNIENNKR